MPENAALTWGHININVGDIDASIAFYRKLGFDVFIPGIPYLNLSLDEFRPVNTAAATALGISPQSRGRACIMQLPGSLPMLDLTQWEDSTTNSPLANADQGIVRICLSSQDLDTDVARLTKAGVQFLSDAREGHDELAKIALCQDPDGSLIELVQIRLERWAPFLTQ